MYHYAIAEELIDLDAVGAMWKTDGKNISVRGKDGKLLSELRFRSTEDRNKAFITLRTVMVDRNKAVEALNADTQKAKKEQKMMTFESEVVETKQTQPGENKMKAMLEDLAAQVKPYQKYIVIAGVLFLIDYFILKGAVSDRLQNLAKAVADRLMSILDAAVSRIGGSNDASR